MHLATNLRNNDDLIRVDMARGIALPLFAILVAVLIAICLSGTTYASDPSPVNPPGEIPITATDAEGNEYLVFTPEGTGSVAGPGFSFSFLPGAVPSALLVAVRMSAQGPASNAGATHHRFTFVGNFYSIDATDADGKRLKMPFTFKHPVPIACIPFPIEYTYKLDRIRLIATDPKGTEQRVITSDLRFDGGIGDNGFGRVCGYVGSVPTTLAVGIEGAPEPLPKPTVEPEETDIEPTVEDRLPPTGGWAPHHGIAILMLVIGLGLLATTKWVSSAFQRE